MLTEFNKIFGRDFIVAFFVPALTFIVASIGLLEVFKIRPIWLQISSADPLKDTTFLALIILVASFCLMALSRLIFRALEGYWPFDLGTKLNFFQKREYLSLKKQLEELRVESELCRKENREFSKTLIYDRLMLRLALEFPSKEHLVRATAFGNTVSAFEDYPRVMYGFESITGWSRLNTVIPKEYQDQMGSARALTDLWVNMWFVSLLFVLEYLVIAALFAYGFEYLWIPCVGLAVMFAASWRARIAAMLWGHWVKAAFDVFLPALCHKLGYKKPSTAEAERKFWLSLSQGITYRYFSSLKELDESRKDTFD